MLGRNDILLQILFSRVLFAAAVLSVLIMMIMFARKNNLAPITRSYLWTLCIPALLIPFERSAVILRQGQVFDVYAIFPGLIFLERLPMLLAHEAQHIKQRDPLLFFIPTIRTMRVLV
jgi:beta-lactamase regulating signal transducer with metallopeptidase domain